MSMLGPLTCNALTVIDPVFPPETNREHQETQKQFFLFRHESSNAIPVSAGGACGGHAQFCGRSAAKQIG